LKKYQTLGENAIGAGRTSLRRLRKRWEGAAETWEC